MFQNNKSKVYRKGSERKRKQNPEKRPLTEMKHFGAVYGSENCKVQATMDSGLINLHQYTKGIITRINRQ